MVSRIREAIIANKEAAQNVAAARAIAQEKDAANAGGSEYELAAKYLQQILR